MCLRWLVVLMAWCGLIAGSAAASVTWQQAGMQLEFKARPQKSPILAGEALVVDVTVQEIKGTPASLGFYGAFTGEIMRGADLISSGSQMQRGGISSPAKIASGTSVTEPVIINNWCSTLLPPGQYTLRLHARPSLCPAASAGRGALKEAFLWPEVTLVCEFEIVPPNEAALRAIFTGLAAQWDGPSVAGFNYPCAAGALGLADSPLALEFQAQLIHHAAGNAALMEDMLRKFARRKDDAATAAMLVQALGTLPPGPETVMTRLKILTAVCRIRGRNAEVLRLTDAARRQAKAAGVEQGSLERSSIVD